MEIGGNGIACRHGMPMQGCNRPGSRLQPAGEPGRRCANFTLNPKIAADQGILILYSSVGEEHSGISTDYAASVGAN
jgi:hypothetical protein